VTGSLPINYCGGEFILLPDRAAWWPARKTLFIADLHLGKAASFRTLGVPVPAGNTTKDLARLSALLRTADARRLVVLGDFLHARAGRQDEVLDVMHRWRAEHDSLEMLLVRGNHDRSAGRVPTDWRIEEVDEPFEESGFIFSHLPRCDEKWPVLAGHVHPVFAMQDYDGSTVRAPCFVFDDARRPCAILPSFGSFTGGHAMDREQDRRVFVSTGTKVVQI